MIRVSVAARCRVMIDDRYLLVVSLNGLARGVRSLSPAGGGVKTTDAGRNYLIDKLGAERFEKGNDLRFHLPEDQLDEFGEWILATDELEPDTAGREFCDELTAERPLLPSELAELVRFTCAQQQRPQDQPWTKMLMWSYPGGKVKNLVETYAFEYVYDATVPPLVQEHLMRELAGPEALIELVTAQEIRDGRTHAGHEITNLATPLLS